MKKIIVVLLITVLVAGFAFAGTFTGSAGIDFGVNFDAHEWGFDNYTWGQYTFKFEFDSAKVSIGAEHQTDVWAELDAQASAYISLAPAANNPTENLIPQNSTNTANLTAYYTAKVTKANIHIGEDLTIGILGPGKAADFASSYYKIYLAANNNKVRSAVAATGTAPGFNVTYKDWTGGFGAEGAWNEEGNEDDEYTIFAHIETPTFKFAEEAVSVKAGAYAFLMDKNQFGLASNFTTDGLPKRYTNFGGGFKAAYASEKVSADLAADAKYMMIPETLVSEAKNTFLFEAAANAQLNFVENLPITANVYVTPGALFTWDGSNAKYVGDYAESLKLDAKVAAAYTVDINDDIALDVSAYAEVKDALIPAMKLKIGATEGTTIDAFTVELTESVALKNLANKDVDAVTELEIEAYVAYAHEKFTAYGDLMAEFLFNKVDNNDVFTNLYFEAGISSDAIVEGAELSLVYGGNARIPYYENGWVDFLDLENHKGAITASCVIYF